MSVLVFHPKDTNFLWSRLSRQPRNKTTTNNTKIPGTKQIKQKESRGEAGYKNVLLAGDEQMTGAQAKQHEDNHGIERSRKEK